MSSQETRIHVTVSSDQNGLTFLFSHNDNNLDDTSYVFNINNNTRIRFLVETFEGTEAARYLFVQNQFQGDYVLSHPVLSFPVLILDKNNHHVTKYTIFLDDVAYSGIAAHQATQDQNRGSNRSHANVYNFDNTVIESLTIFSCGCCANEPGHHMNMQ